MRISLSTPIQEFPRVGPTTARRLQKLGITTAKDVLLWYPSRYEDFRSVTPIAQIQGNSHSCARGTIHLLTRRRSPRKRMSLAEAIIQDASGSIKIIWFNQPYLTKTLNEGDDIFVAGRVEAGKYGIQFVNPVFELASDNPTHTARVVPIYPTTTDVGQKLIRSLARAVLPLADSARDIIPERIRVSHHLMPLADALKIIHFPITTAHAQQARERLALQEMVALLHKLGTLNKKQRAEKAISCSCESHRELYTGKLPFTLTGAQKRTIEEIYTDLSTSHPMNRLINGDVGSGKTILAHLAALCCASSEVQAVLLAPTEILAQQHYASFKKTFKDTQATFGLFTRSTRKIYSHGKERDITKKEMLKSLEDGTLYYIIGTHTLIQKTVAFKKLSLVIVDEQHRFGVYQRAELPVKTFTQQGYMPHFLSLTATPIPRSLARILFGGGDVSLLDEKPPGRKTITTTILKENDREKAYEHIRKEIAAGHQAFVICPIIEESDTLGVKAATKEYEYLKNDVFPDIPIGLVHGKQSATLREKTMKEFSDNTCHILVATAVVEVGVDVPNATVMIIEGANRFGLAQLHQFRGRIGRSSDPATCYALAATHSKVVDKRLEVFSKTDDGFTLAQEDLKFRGPGTLFGILQSGQLYLRLADLSNTALLSLSQAIVKEMNKGAIS